MTTRMPNWAAALCFLATVVISIGSPLAGFAVAAAMAVVTRHIPAWRNGFIAFAILILIWLVLGFSGGTVSSTEYP